MMYRLNEQVYPVSGAAKDCLYDLANKKLWQIGKDTAALIRRCISEPDAVFTAEEQAAIRTMTENGLLSEGQAGIPDIRELRYEPKPDSAWIEVCTVCNLRCIHCYNAEQPELFMPDDDFRLVCSRLSEAGIRRVQLIGGEPLCHPRITEFLKTASQFFDTTELFTNGTLLTEQLCTVLLDAHIRAALSVYSYEDAAHDAVTGINGSHQRTEHALSLLRTYGIPHRTAAIRMKGICIGERGCKSYQISGTDIVRMSGRGSSALLDAELLREKLITKETFRRPLDPERVAAAVSGNPCFSRKIYVAADLTVYPCVMERRLRHGNLRDAALPALLSQDILHLNKDRTDGCAACEFRYACPDCKPDSFAQSPAAKPYYCTYDEQRGVWLDPESVIAALFNATE